MTSFKHCFVITLATVLLMAATWALPPEARAQVCVSDSNGSGEVTVNELITLVNIALGNAQPSACPTGVPSGDTVDIVLILQAVNNALNGCEMA
ncbi:MAG TPA: hypothetical protein VN812_17010 [Candidatus Acidoferrales bacterium]|nr:hypothetical protein [Candidatus Acidoferrales bacterium]